MSDAQHKLILHCLSRLEKLQARYAADQSCEELISHTGDLSESDLEAILGTVERSAKASGDKSSVVKKLFSVTVESLQNLRAHGARSEQGGMAICIVIGTCSDGYLINTGNPIENGLVESLKAHIEKINGIDRTALREFYMQVLSDGSRSAKGGAGLGLITIALRSQNAIELEIDPINDEFSYLNLGFKINR